ncbi:MULTISPECIES: hypothetical protein [Sutcliffiella]|uniref:Uncharacterized protein n=1 Tax=Sutcliffiella cohnii TaxID=33932 RepID=A0A223KV74_9BACI|nr:MULTISPECIES: hypothetical protein [Sutcliffiella]AST93381.1 hypothetical protein BC6307_19995 [Sutcliffiella cohnii]WBL14547.1 hypothetical protein O1A01_22160 [Sutcliffiella sp. NC1]
MFKKILNYFNSRQVPEYYVDEEFGLYQEIDEDLGMENENEENDSDIDDDIDEIYIDDENYL